MPDTFKHHRQMGDKVSCEFEPSLDPALLLALYGADFQRRLMSGVNPQLRWSDKRLSGCSTSSRDLTGNDAITLAIRGQEMTRASKTGNIIITG